MGIGSAARTRTIWCARQDSNLHCLRFTGYSVQLSYERVRMECRGKSGRDTGAWNTPRMFQEGPAPLRPLFFKQHRAGACAERDPWRNSANQQLAHGRADCDANGHADCYAEVWIVRHASIARNNPKGSRLSHFPVFTDPAAGAPAAVLREVGSEPAARVLSARAPSEPQVPLEGFQVQAGLVAHWSRLPLSWPLSPQPSAG